MPNTESHCTNYKIGQFLRDAKSDDLFAPNRRADRIVFFEHLDECETCRAAMLEQANEIAFEQVAYERGMALGNVIEELGQATRMLQETALSKGITVEEALAEVLSQDKRISLAVKEQGI
jgi:succinylglutamate desuccinylase